MSADTGADDRATGRHRFEGGLTEWLDQARLAHDMRGGDQPRDSIVGDDACQLDTRNAFKLRTERAPACKRQCPFA